MKAESRIITIRLPSWLIEQLDEDARAQGINRTEFIKRLYLGWKDEQADLAEYLKFMAAQGAAEGTNKWQPRQRLTRQTKAPSISRV